VCVWEVVSSSQRGMTISCLDLQQQQLHVRARCAVRKRIAALHAIWHVFNDIICPMIFHALLC